MPLYQVLLKWLVFFKYGYYLAVFFSSKLIFSYV